MKRIKLKESDLRKIIKRIVLEQDNTTGSRRRRIHEQGGTSWCSLCVQSHPPSYCSANSNRPCHANFNKNAISCTSCKALFAGQNTLQRQQSIDNHCNQPGQPCHSTITPWIGGPGQAKGRGVDDIHAKVGKPKGDSIKLRESDLKNIIRKIISRR